MKSELDRIESHSYRFNAHFPMIESKTVMKGIIFLHIVEHFSCEEQE
jgi:hypothetical protein